MKFLTKLSLLVFFCLFLDLSWGEDSGKCQECGSKSLASCVDETSYRFCMNGKPMGDVLTCDEGFVCTNSAAICEKKTEKEPLCSSSCNKCSTVTGSSPYTCVSKTDFGRCVNNKVTMVSSCGEDLVCNVEMLKYGSVCAPQCVLDFFELTPTCVNEQPITTTVAPPSTTINVQNLKEKCREAGNAEKVFLIPNQHDCATYIYCEKTSDGSSYEALLMKCSKGYFDSAKNKCTEEATCPPSY